jgi:hypothetical protein
MTKINGTEVIAREDPALAQGYVRVSAALVDAGCDAFFARRGIHCPSVTRAGIDPKLRERASRDRQRNGDRRRQIRQSGSDSAAPPLNSQPSTLDR